MDFSPYFLQLSAGCIGLAPVVPWRAVGKGYHVMMLAIGIALLVVGRLLGPPVHPVKGEGPIPLYVLFGVGSSLALGWFLVGSGEPGSWWARLAAAIGWTAVFMDGMRAADVAKGPAAHWALLAFNFLSGALLLGSALSAMLLGHWYLVVKDLPVRPLRTLTILLFVGLGARLAATVAAFALDPEGGKAVADRSFLFVLVYGLFSLGTPLAMSWMVWGTVKIRSTQAATGILYGVVVFVLMGEAAGRFVLLKTGFPL